MCHCVCLDQQCWLILLIMHVLSPDMSKYEIDSGDEELPFACYICREQFTNPVITK